MQFNCNKCNNTFLLSNTFKTHMKRHRITFLWQLFQGSQLHEAKVFVKLKAEGLGWSRGAGAEKRETGPHSQPGARPACPSKRPISSIIECTQSLCYIALCIWLHSITYLFNCNKCFKCENTLLENTLLENKLLENMLYALRPTTWTLQLHCPPWR